MHSGLVGYIKQRPWLYHATIGTRLTLRYGLPRQMLHWLLHGHIVRRAAISRRLARGIDRLQVGGGYHVIPDWINGDLIAGDIYLDATKRLPFPDNSLGLVFTEHFFEHLSLEDGLHFLREVHRVLKPGGVLRQSTPDLGRLVELYRDKSPFVPLEAAAQHHHRGHHSPHRYHLVDGSELLNDFMRLWGHRFVYDRPSLERVTKDAGFDNLQWCEFGKSEHRMLKARERHAGDVAWIREIVMLLEATKSG